MAFDFTGTFTPPQWQDFEDFSYLQRTDLYARSAWLSARLVRIGIFTTEYNEDGSPKSFSATPGSYAAKLIEGYKILGGIPERDMLLRTRDKPVYLISGQGSKGCSTTYSNTRRDRGSQKYDQSLGLAVQKVRSWLHDPLKMKREQLEYKIKRALDHSDRLQQEIAKIGNLLKDDEYEMDSMVIEVKMLAGESGRTNISDADRFGLGIGTVPDPTFADSALVGKEGNQRGPNGLAKK